MRYFQEHFEIIPEKAELITFDNQEDIKNNRALKGDQVWIHQKEVIAIHSRNKEPLFGIVDLDIQKVQYQDTKRRKYYKFFPEGENNPPFLVGVRNSKLTKPFFAKVIFWQWTPFQKMPFGQVQHQYGSTNDFQAEISFRLGKDNLYFQPKLIANNWQKSPLEFRQFCSSEYFLFSCDPQGSRDVDDAIHFDSLKQEIGIHIADPTQFFNPLSSQTPHSSFYLPEKELPMLGQEITYHQATLLADNRNRSAISVVISLDNQGQAVDYHIYRSQVEITSNFSYNEARKRKKHLPLNQLLKLPENTEPEESIKESMVLANSCVADYLVKQGCPLLRGDNQLAIEQVNGIPEKYQSLAMRLFSQSRVEYSLDREEFYHGGLGKSKYTHFTSPIRRLFDCLVHWTINYPDDARENWMQIKNKIVWINQQEKKERRFQRWMEHQELIKSLIDQDIWSVNISQAYFLFTRNDDSLVFLIDQEPLEGKILDYKPRPEVLKEYLQEWRESYLQQGKVYNLTLQVIPDKFDRLSLDIVKIYV